MLRRLVPLDIDARTMAAEDGICRIVHIPLRLVADGSNDFLGIVAGLIAPQSAAQLSLSAGLDRHLLPVILQLRHRPTARQNRHIALCGGIIHGAAHVLYVGHGASHAVVGHL